ncbi:MFS transporter [Wohlfahrtiimonas larvae]|uniref:MFS transporter n=1 Tax=Wohlfahrtiimonas larvae TaxID=1157986 RepID=A0ABP9MLE1_9GAMM|nr:MFS transporter [Wohlfahrtiimonas larvae]
MASYATLLRTPGAKGFVLAGLLARLPVSMTAIGIITMLSEMNASYTLAGGVAAVFTLSCAIIAPRISRLVDRYGQSKVLPYAAIIALLSILSLLAVAHWQLPSWLLFVFAVLGGFTPNMSAMVRARWTEIYRGKPELQTAYALESVLDELCFIVGPPLSVGLCVGLFPQAGPLLAMLFLALGVTAFVVQKKTEPAVNDVEVYNASVFRLTMVKALTLLMIFLGIIVGTIDVASVAFAKAQEMPATASLVLSFYAVSSCAAGLIFGMMQFKISLAKCLMMASIATMLSSIPLLIVWNITSLSITVFVAGFFFSPTMITAMSLIEENVPDEQLTEGLTWLLSGLGIGVALGAAMAGFVIDLYSVSAGFAVALLSSISVLCTAVYICRFQNRHI